MTSKRYLRRSSSVIAGCALLGLVGCGGGGGGGGPSGTSTISGNVSDQSMVMRGAAARPLLARVGALLGAVRRAEAGVANIHVTVAGIGTDTDDNGFFVLNGVPAGTVSLVFQAGTVTFVFLLDVPVDTTLMLHDIVLANGRAQPANIVIQGKGSEGVDDMADVDFQGTVTALNCPASITVMRSDGQVIVVDLSGSVALGVPCLSLGNQPVDIQGAPAGSVVMAHKVKIHED